MLQALGKKTTRATDRGLFLKHFIQYHKKEKMGYPALDVDNLSIYTKKSISATEGDWIWLIAGEGSPREYYLRAVFKFHQYVPSEKPDFTYRVSGRFGQLFDPMPELTKQPWFPVLLRNQGNFAFGFSRITQSAVLDGLRGVLEENKMA